MKKYITMDFDEKGKPVLGRAKDTATGGFVPTAWVPASGGNGIIGIEISPAIETTPTLDSFLPIYYENLSDPSVEIQVTTILSEQGDYILSVTPTSEWYVGFNTGDAPEFGDKGETVTLPITLEPGVVTDVFGLCANATEEAEDVKWFGFTISINVQTGK